MKYNRRGFAPVLLLPLAVIVLIVGVGIYIHLNKTDNAAEKSNSTPTSQSKEALQSEQSKNTSTLASDYVDAEAKLNSEFDRIGFYSDLAAEQYSKGICNDSCPTIDRVYNRNPDVLAAEPSSTQKLFQSKGYYVDRVDRGVDAMSGQYTSGKDKFVFYLDWSKDGRDGMIDPTVTDKPYNTELTIHYEHLK